MRMMLGGLLLLACAAPAFAEDKDADDFCTSPSGIGTRACIFPEGRVVVETSLVDLTVDDAFGRRIRSVEVGATEVRVGVSRLLEAQVGFTPFRHEHLNDRVTGVRETDDSIGELTLGAKVGLVSSYEDPLSLAVQPFVTIPVAHIAIGGDVVGAGLLLPVSYDLSDAVTLNVTPEITSTGNQEGSGRHFEYGATVGIDVAISDAISTTAEFRHIRDRDPTRDRSENIAALSVAWQVANRSQLNLGGAAGLTRRSPKIELMVGIARHFG